MYEKFGLDRNWARLVNPEWQATKLDAEQMVAVAAEITMAEAFWRDRKPDRDYYFLLYNTKCRPSILIQDVGKWRHKTSASRSSAPTP